MSKSPAESLEGLLREKYSPLTPWAYHWVVKFADMPSSDALRIRLTWWTGCGDAEVHNIENVVLPRGLGPGDDLAKLGELNHFMVEIEGRAKAMLRDMAASFLHKGR